MMMRARFNCSSTEYDDRLRRLVPLPSKFAAIIIDLWCVVFIPSVSDVSRKPDRKTFTLPVTA